MQLRSERIQSHQLHHLLKTLQIVEDNLGRSIRFLTDYAQVYRFPKMITRRNLKELKKMKDAAESLKDLQLKHLK